MTSSDANSNFHQDDEQAEVTAGDVTTNGAPPKYEIRIKQAEGVAIGDHPTVIIQPPPEPYIDLAEAEKTYRSQVIKKYNSLSFSWFEHDAPSLVDVPLEHIFVRLALTVEKVIREPIPPEESSKQKRGEEQPRERVITVQEPIELDQALTQHLLIVGEPGAGKSTLLRWLAVTFAQERQREPDRLGPYADIDRLPVLVELGHLPECYLRADGGEPPNWIEFLPDYITKGEMAFTAVPPQLLTQALKTGRCLLLFDGLDEVANRQARIRLTESLAELARFFPGNRVAIGSRPAGASESMLPSLFRQSHIARFTSADIQRFFRFWYALAGDERLTRDQRQAEADVLYARVQAAPATLRLATTPLLSTILVLIWRQEGVLPERRVELYERYCRVLIEQWEWVKKAHAVVYPKELDDMDWEDHIRLLMPIAYAIHSQEQRTSATKDDLVDLLARTLPTLGYADEQAANRIAKQFLATLGLRSGLLQYVGDDRYGFPHLTFQEYLAARYIAAQPDPEYIDLVMTHLHEAWWQEVHLLTIGLLGSGSAQKAQEAEANTKKASALLLTILHGYKPPSVQQRIFRLLAREFELAAKGYAECASNVTMPTVDAVLSTQAASLLRDLVHDEARYKTQENLLTAIGLLQRRGNKAVMNALLKYILSDSLWPNAADSLAKLGAGGNEETIGALLRALHDPSEGARIMAARGLAKLGAGGNEEVIGALLTALRDPSGHRRREAAESLGELGSGGNEEVVRALLTTLHDPVYMRMAAAPSLAKLGAGGNKEAVRALLTFLRDPDLYVRTAAIRSLGELGVGSNEEVVRALLTALHEPDWYPRAAAIRSLAKLGAGGNEEIVRALLTVLHDTEGLTEVERNLVRVEAVRSLGELGVGGNEEIVRALLTVLHDPSGGMQREAAVSLAKLGVGGNEEIVRALLIDLRSPSWSRQNAAVLGLGELGVGSNEEIVRALLTVLHDPSGGMQREAAVSLAKLGAGGNEEVVGALLTALRETHLYTRAEVARSLGELGTSSNEEVVGALLTALRDPDWVVQREVVHSLGRLGIKSGVQRNQALVAFSRLLRDEYSGTRDEVLTTTRKLLDGHPLPGYRWVSLQERRARRLRLKRIAFWLGMVAVLLVVALGSTRFLGYLDPNGFIMRYLGVLAAFITVAAAIAQIRGWSLRDPWERR